MPLRTRYEGPAGGPSSLALRRADEGAGPRGGAAAAASSVLHREEEGLLTPVWVGLASGVMALAIAQAEAFAPLRARLTGRLAYLSTCPLCLGAWLSAGLLLIQGPPPGLAWPVAWGASWAVSTATAWGLDRLAGEPDEVPPER